MFAFMNRRTFADFEREGWDRNAPDYADNVLPLTEQAFVPLLDSLGDLGGKRVLEIACGTGQLAQAANARGADVVGIDFAETMISLARKNAPGAGFRVGRDHDLAGAQERARCRVSRGGRGGIAF
jgi:2-polyprenyl-3-methyl-5-hydroxy-6-metoxy-1,4-benzoquinol methylase